MRPVQPSGGPPDLLRINWQGGAEIYLPKTVTPPMAIPDGVLSSQHRPEYHVYRRSTRNPHIYVYQPE